jgi:hypothetical protein
MGLRWGIAVYDATSGADILKVLRGEYGRVCKGY